MEDRRQSPVHRLRGANDSAAMHSAQCLMAQAHAQDRQVTALLQKRQAEAWQTAPQSRAASWDALVTDDVPKSSAACGVPGPGERTTVGARKAKTE